VFGNYMNGCFGGAAVGEFTADTAFFYFDWTLVPEIVGPIVGCGGGMIAVHQGGGDLVDAFSESVG
jgi:hypothetical protein